MSAQSPLKGPEPIATDNAGIAQILRTAVQEGASDVHFKAGEPVLIRIKGALLPLKVARLTPDATHRIFEALRPRHLAGLAAADVQELDFSFALSGAGRFRVNVFRQRGSLALVIRVIPNKIPDFKELRLPGILPSLAEEKRGLILVTGTTGSGKSTTLAAMINHINQSRTAHVVTIEDPIEFLFLNRKSSVVQREIGVDTGSFAKALRAVLRQDPDVIMIGEMRDTETIDIAMKAAETGHLVISTAHTTDAAKTVQRLLAVFSPAEQAMMRIRLAETLKAVVSQRLLPRLDGQGLVPAVEVMVNTRVVQECIRDDGRAHEIPEFVSKGRHYGMQAFDQHLLALLQEGLISKEVALSAATSASDLDLQIRMGGEEEELAIERHDYSEMDEY
ncbi:MAG: type IV pilus twitching motility protein PilT [Myxococcota bacterium]